MTAHAVVVAAYPDGSVDLEFQPSERCAGCAGVCLWRRLEAQRLRHVALSKSAELGDPMLVSLPERSILLAAVATYGLPLAGLLGGALLGARVTGSDLGAAAGAGAALLAIFIWLPALRRRVERMTMASLRVDPGA